MRRTNPTLSIDYDVILVALPKSDTPNIAISNVRIAADLWNGGDSEDRR